MSDVWFLGKQRYLLNVVTGANCVALLAALPWISATVSVSPELRSSMAMAGFGALAMGFALSESLAAREHRAFRGLATAELLVSVRSRLDAIGELGRVGHRVLRANLVSGAVAGVLLAFISRMFLGAPVSLALRLMLVVSVVTLLGGMMGTLWVYARANTAVDALSDRLEVDAVVDALGVEAGFKVRTLVIVTACVLVAVPSLMVLDTGWELLSAALEERRVLASLGQRFDLDGTLQLLALRLLLVVMGSVLVAVVVARSATHALGMPLQRVALDAVSIVEARLRPRFIFGSVGEVREVTSSFARLKGRLLFASGQLRDAASGVETASGSLSTTAHAFESAGAEQGAALNQTSATTEELAHSARQVASNAAAVHDLARKTLQAAQRGQAGSSAFVQAVDRMRQDSESITAAVDRLQQRVQQIGRIVEVINAVADRSDLLALSAELEGTRAGEVGRGFSLVAAEMRRLAENVLDSTAEIDELIGEIRQATAQTAEATAHASTFADSSSSLAQSVTGALQTVAEFALQTSEAVRSISLATQQQQTGTDQLAEAMTEILGVSHLSLSTTQQLARAKDQLLAVSSRLKSVVDRFGASPS